MDDLRRFYAQLLGKPLREIAALTVNLNPAFKANYEALMLNWGKWIVSQKAFKEVAMRLGASQGLSEDDIFVMAHEAKFDVLRDRNPSPHGTNAGDVPVAASRTQEIERALLKEGGEFADYHRARVESGDLYDLLDEPPQLWNAALRVWKRLAGQDDRRAKLNLGFAYQHSATENSDYSMAAELLEKAHAQGEPRAAYQLHTLYMAPSNPQRDELKAAAYLEQALAAGDPRAPAVKAEIERQQADKLAKEAAARDLEVRRAQWKEEEPELLKQVSVIREGVFPEELFERIRGREYGWLYSAEALHTLTLSAQMTDERNKGGFIFSDWQVAVTLFGRVSPKGDRRWAVTFGIWSDATQSYIEQTAHSDTKRGVPYALGFHSEGTRLDRFKLLVGAGTGEDGGTREIEFTYIPKQPVVVKRPKR